METTQQLITHENNDSLEIGTPGKGGVIKVFGDFGDKEKFEKKLRTAMEMRDLAKTLMQTEEKVTS